MNDKLDAAISGFYVPDLEETQIAYFKDFCRKQGASDKFLSELDSYWYKYFWQLRDKKVGVDKKQ